MCSRGGTSHAAFDALTKAYESSAQDVALHRMAVARDALVDRINDIVTNDRHPAATLRSAISGASRAPHGVGADVSSLQEELAEANIRILSALDERDRPFIFKGTPMEDVIASSASVGRSPRRAGDSASEVGTLAGENVARLASAAAEYSVD